MSFVKNQMLFLKNQMVFINFMMSLIQNNHTFYKNEMDFIKITAAVKRNLNGKDRFAPHKSTICQDSADSYVTCSDYYTIDYELASIPECQFLIPSEK